MNVSIRVLNTRLIILATIVVSACREELPIEPLPPHVPEMRGFSYTSFTADGFGRGAERNALGDLVTQTANNWIALVLFEYQSTATSFDIGPNTTGINPLTGGSWSTTSTEADVREGIRHARLHNLKIMLKPHIDLYSGEWRAAIRPDTDGNWFRSYNEMVLRYARIAEELNVELLCIGTELISATQPQYTSSWNSLAASTRLVYRGHLTYGANWTGAHQFGITRPEFEQIGFWEKLDYIGINTYYPLTNSLNDPIPSFTIAYGRVAASVREIGLLSSRANKPVIITEIGIQSTRGALSVPWDYSLGRLPDAIPDTTAQEFYYRVMIEAVGKQPWCGGMFWWNWESVVTATEATNYTPRNKPAARTLRKWYTSIQGM